MSRCRDRDVGLKLLGRAAGQRVVDVIGGPARAQVVIVLALVLALSSADMSAIGADVAPLRRALHIDFTEVGLLVAVPSLVGAVATLPVGILSDRVCRVSLLKWSIVLWSVGMFAAGASSSFSMLLVSRLVIGIVTATSGPTLASLTGDFFDPRERGKIYGFILSGDLVGSVVGLLISGNVAAISWRLAFWVLAIPSALAAWAVWRFLPEPDRGGADRLSPPPGATARGTQGMGAVPREPPRTSELETALRHAGVRPRSENVIGDDDDPMMLSAAVRYVLRVRTNVALIVASALGYFFVSGILTFGVAFIRHHYAVGQSMATSLLGVIALGALAGVLGSGRLADALLRRGRVAARVVVAGACLVAASGLFLVPLLSRSLVIGVPLLWLAAMALYGSNPPLDAARLDIIPHSLWGRAEAVRTLLRSVTTAAAPLLFGVLSDRLGSRGAATHAGGQAVNSGGIGGAFLIMLIPLLGAGLILLLRAAADYPRDVRTAMVSDTSGRHATRPRARGGREPATEAPARIPPSETDVADRR